MGVAKGTKTGLQEEDIRDGLVIKVCGTEEALRTYLLAGGRSAARVGPPDSSHLYLLGAPFPSHLQVTLAEEG